MPLPFRPKCLPAALGPLPHRTARLAWDVCLRYLPDVLTIPLLADHGEDPLRASVQGFGGVTVVRDQVVFDHDASVNAYDELYLAYLQDRAATRSINLGAFTEWPAREAHIKRAQAVCTTMMGPISAALRLVDVDGVAALNDLDVVDALAKHICLRLEWQHSVINRSTSTVVQWLYEPYLDVVGSPFSPVDWRRAGELLEQAFGERSGVHAVWTGSSTSLEALLAEQVVDVVGLPLPLPSAVAQWGAALKEFVGHQGVIGWGIVPNTVEGLQNARVGRLAARFTDLLQAFEAVGLSTQDVIASSLIMPEDTLGHLDANAAESSLAMVNQLSGMLRHSYGLD